MLSLPKTKMEPEKEIIDFVKFFFKFKPRKYQERFLLDCTKRKKIVAIWSRQSGKSTSVANYVAYVILTNPGLNVLIVSPTQRQSSELFKKVKNIFESDRLLLNYTDTLTQTEIQLNNKSRAISLPCGPSGKTILGYTADILILEESQDIKDEIVNKVLLPMIASKTENQIIKIGTPFNKNHFYESVTNEKLDYSVHKITWKNALEDGHYSKDTLDDIRSQVTTVEWATEFECEFIEDRDSYFTTTTIQNAIEDYKMIGALI